MAVGALIPAVRWTAIGTDGNPAPGAKLYTYLSGTNTPQPVYSDYTLGTPITQPVTADTVGQFQTFYTSAVAYRVFMTDAVGATLIPATDHVYDFSQVQLGTAGTSTGSALIGFIQAGTGATARTAQTKMREVFSVTDFGAVGDGTTNDYAAFAAALAAAKAMDPNGYRGTRVTVPYGVYRLSTGLTLTSHIIFEGVGGQTNGDETATGGTERAGTVLLFDTGITGITATDTAAGGFSIIRDMEIRAAGKSGSSIGINASTRLFIDNCHVVGFHSHGINFTASSPTGNANGWRVERTRIEDNGGDGLHVSGTDANSGVAYIVDSVSNTGYGFFNNATYGSTYLACSDEGNTACGVKSSSRSVYVGHYNEGGQPTNDLDQPGVIIGGTWFSGFTTGMAPIRLSDDKICLGATLNPAYSGSESSVLSRGSYTNQGPSIVTAVNAYASLGRVAHGMTTIAPTDTWYSEGISGSTGGILRQALTGANIGFDDRAYVTTVDTTTSGVAVAPFYFNAFKANGTGTTTLGATDNLAVIGNAGTGRYIFKGDGTAYADVAWSTFDAFEDSDLLTALTTLARPKRPADRLAARVVLTDMDMAMDASLLEMDANTLQRHRETLEKHDIITVNDGPKGDGSVWVNTTRVQMVATGAIRQQADVIRSLMARLDALEAK